MPTELDLPPAPTIPDETQEPIVTPVEELPSLDPPHKENELHLAKDPDHPELGAMCGYISDDPRLHMRDCRGDIIRTGYRYKCSGCGKFICRTCIDLMITHMRSGRKEW